MPWVCGMRRDAWEGGVHGKGQIGGCCGVTRQEHMLMGGCAGGWEGDAVREELHIFIKEIAVHSGEGRGRGGECCGVSRA
jgi:hypothetical protein